MSVFCSAIVQVFVSRCFVQPCQLAPNVLAGSWPQETSGISSLSPEVFPAAGGTGLSFGAGPQPPGGGCLGRGGCVRAKRARARAVGVQRGP
eukprot:8033979-Lingulodinium_polyedra.AAC.1